MHAAHQLAGRYLGAAQAFVEALAISRDLGDRLGQAWALLDLGGVRWDTGDYPGAAQMVEQALGIYPESAGGRARQERIMDESTSAAGIAGMQAKA